MAPCPDLPVRCRCSEERGSDLRERTGGTTLEIAAAGRGLDAASLPWSEAKPLWQAASYEFSGKLCPERAPRRCSAA